MPLNLITDPWLPVRTETGRRIIRPDQIAEPGVLAPDWPRADLDVACLELLIGLVYMADPPTDAQDWEARRAPDPDRLRAALAPLADAFHLGGEGPRFLQDMETLDGAPNPPDMLFIDSAGGNTAKNNADLFVRRGRYPALDPALAAMTLFTLQAHAPSGGAGNRTSMRGGGPLVTLVDPGGSLWDLVWANVPDGTPQGPETLPWMRPTRTSEKGTTPTYPPKTNQMPAEVFFGMPRRLRLVFEGNLVTGVIQRPYGTEYEGWRHPLTPYYEPKAGAGWLPQHPRAGAFGYRQWLGIVMDGQTGDTTRRADALTAYDDRVPGIDRLDVDRQPTVMVAGWSMDNMKPREFLLSREPLLALDGARQDMVRGMVAAANAAGDALRGALKPVVGSDDAKKSALSLLHERFFTETEAGFRDAVARRDAGQGAVAEGWLQDMRRVALGIFDAFALPGLADRPSEEAREIIQARGRLLALFAGYGKAGAGLYDNLRLEVPKKKEKAA
ncbi:type I-E CRISPR-associated protein Cse1/CasA [Boseongicola sp. H5]|uniref:type I-E CRISPR-associated protein Cse1/CasA n=1 Tax=Boseongicola sp. H5 TaxID=2763261 RepID=UPI001D0B10BA|nr:type I-E CRISPR-associated protein Cse1/CasA [Boseongicola sp. H5]